MSKTSWIVVLLVVVSLGLGIRKAIAQVYESQPFVAVETSISRRIQSPVPYVHNSVIAISDGGNLIARLSRSRFADNGSHTRWIINNRDKTNTMLDEGNKVRVAYPWNESMARGVSLNKVGDHCEGSPGDKIEGLDTYVRETTGTSGNDGDTAKNKWWMAPKLGCYVIRDEWQVLDKTGKQLSSGVHTLTQIVVGEPDPSYFDTSLKEGFTDSLPEDYKGALVNHLKATE